MAIKVTKASNLKPHPADDKLGFGKIFTDHMFNMDYAEGKGWFDPRIEPYAALSCDPAMLVFHYGQAIFEGLKAYRTPKGNVQLFRPQANFARFNRSASMLCIPNFDEAEALDHLRQLISVEKDWVPSSPGTSLYIRPTIIATDNYLGVAASQTYRFFTILSPVGAYYAEGFAPIKILVTTEHVRASRQGIGEAKTAANYAASLLAGHKAAKAGYTQVLWLDAVERKYVEEVGSMNIFFVIDGEVVTPELNGSILPGITRDSVLTMARHWGLPVSERHISIEEIFEANENGKLEECFGTGTAAVISPVGELRYDERVITIRNNEVGPLSQKLYDAITGIQFGEKEDPFGWIVPVD
ncbi:branched-chain amino acid aminotransferase [Desulfatibacillum aliphaticivorans]|uniref:Branched-chain-amino-acid aminotransferase n=1 Tax=Desulfatibacillum aliphaticivorans TaxID=218208 RepID=B8FH10_DESAL|nr:branched-chain amino acid aminotransferase [Desulfatibacillum aliphaticivorans]ACL02098.1 branched-chain amino acid aminotransferase [Desulfatibacillum aliphaticivorans]